MGLDKMQTLFTSINTQRSTKELVNCIYEQKVAEWEFVQTKLLAQTCSDWHSCLWKTKTKNPRTELHFQRGRCVFLITSADLINVCDNCISRFAYIRLTEMPASLLMPCTRSLSQVENQNHRRRVDKYIGYCYIIIIIPVSNYFALTDYKHILL